MAYEAEAAAEAATEAGEATEAAENVLTDFAETAGENGNLEADIYEGAADTATAPPEGSFSINDWAGYPERGVPQPEGPFRVLEGAEYQEARSAANAANRAIRQANPEAYADLQIHEIQPVKFGGDPVGPLNKIALQPEIHAEFTAWWNQLLRILINGN